MRVAVFVHGCFWHRHPGCREAATPRSNSDYWEPKLDRNVARDAEHAAALITADFRVLTIWECQIERDVNAAVATIETALGSPRMSRISKPLETA